jgi:DNA-binding Lrp family transcriptional regulator
MPEPLHAEADLVLVAELQRDARQTNRSLAKKAGLAPSTTLNRVRDLEQRGVLKGYHANVDLISLGRTLQAMVFVRLQPKSDDVIDGFLDHMWGLPETIAVHLITGVEDAIIHLAVADAESLQRVIINEISSFPGVFDERTSLLFEHRRKDVITPL